MEEIELSLTGIDNGHVVITVKPDGTVFINDVLQGSIGFLKAVNGLNDNERNFIIDVAEAFIRSHESFETWSETKSDKSHCSKSQVFTNEMLIDSLQRKTIIEHSNMQWSHGGEYQPFNPEQTLISKEDNKSDNDIKEVIQIKEAGDNNNNNDKLQVLKEVPAFHEDTTECTCHTCNNSTYRITSDGRIKIDPPEPYNVYIYTTVAEIVRLRRMTEQELMGFMKAYQKQTHGNKRYALRAFLRDIADSVFPPAAKLHDYSVEAEDLLTEPTVTPEVADERGSLESTVRSITPALNWSEEDNKPESNSATQPTDPYVLKKKMSKRTIGLWEKFANKSTVK